MTHQNHQTNGASLEDCHTNFFALTDLCGIKWRKYLIGERPNATGEPLDDPVLKSYARCLESEILCVWRRVAAPKQEQDPNNTISYDIVTSHTHPPLSLTAAKELWIFWYGDEPDLTGLLDQELLKTSGSDSGAWESGLSYECRSLLFKALHNLIERCLLSKDIVRLGKWFVQPCTTNDQIFGQSSQNLSFSFTFFVHGDTVCASIDLREHPAVRPLTPEYLLEASNAANSAAAAATAASSSSSSTTQQQQQQLSTNIVNNLNTNNNNNNNNNNNSNSNNDIKPKPVILAPFGMAATLTGDSFRTIDPATDKLLKDWCSFYPLCNKDNSELPPIVEVISGGVKMRYPSKYVLVTDLDEKTDGNITTNINNLNDTTLPLSPLHSINQTSQQNHLNNNNIVGQQTTTTTTTIVTNLSQISTTQNHTILKTNSPILTTKHNFESKTLTIYETFINNNNLGNIQNTHVIPTVAIEIPERVWQDCIINPVTTTTTTLSTLNLNQNDSRSSCLTLNNNNNNNNDTISGNLDGNSNEQEQKHNNQNCTANNNNIETNNKNLWDCIDPTQKSPCICIRCNKKQSGGGNRSSSSSGKISSSLNSGVGGCSVGVNNTSSSSSNNRSDRNLRFNRIPFHKRFNNNNNNNFIDGQKCHQIYNHHNNNNQHYYSQQKQQQQQHLVQQQQHLQKQQQLQSHNQQNKFKFDEKFNNNFINAAAASNSSPAMIDTSLQSQRSVNSETPIGGGSSYSRNSIGDSMPVPSVGSPGSAIMSPHPNSQLSQPTSVPPAELLPVISPRGPTSVPSMQPPTPLDNLDKNTPAPTPTDQHDNKSITASPYIQPTPSVEPPSSVDAIINNNPGSCAGGGGNSGIANNYNTNNSISGVINPMSVPGVKKFEAHTPLSSAEHQQQAQQSRSNNSGNNQNHPLGFGIGGNNTNSTVNSSAAFLQLFKRPFLSTKDFENNMDDDNYPQLLYDYSTLNAWMDLPVKRFRPNEVKPHRKINHKNVYHSHTHSQPAPMPSPTTMSSCMGYSMSNDFQIKKEIHDYDSGNENDMLIDMKRKIGLMTCSVGGSINSSGNVVSGSVTESGKNSKISVTGNLYTEQGLQVSPDDLDDLFNNTDDMSADNSACEHSGENSNDETSLQVHTPPDSDKSNGCGMEDIKRSLNTNNNPNTSILRPEELSKMFPTPPSHEHHPNSSPMSGGGMNDIHMTDLNDNSGICGSIISSSGGVNNNNNIITKIKQEIYTDLGSPIDEPIEDWSYVHLPPTISKFLGSSKYAPLTNLPSQSLPQINIPPNTFYKPSWLQPQRQQQQQQQQQQHQQQNQQHQQHQQQHQQDQLHLQPLQQPRTPLSNFNVHPMSRQGANTPNNIIGNLGAIQHNTLDSSGKLTPIHQQSAANPMLVNQLNYRPATPSMLRQTMSPISPAAQQFLQNSPMNHMNRRTPIHPPPPYELAVSSPATSTSSYLNKQFNSQEPADTPCSQNGIGNNQQFRSPEANSLLVNVLLYDTALNIFRDHNFDSCTLCVCNATQQCVGNIRGSDSGLYVALPGTSFNPAQTNGNSNNNSTKMLTAGSGMNSGSNMMRNLSAFGIDSPSCGPNSVSGNSSSGNNINGTNQHLTGYIDEDQILCSCGFSAAVNRRLAHRSGLFYEDEMDITGMAEDPYKYKKKSILSLLLNDSSLSTIPSNGTITNDNQIISKIDTDLPQMIMDLLRDQCTFMQTSISSIQKALSRCRRKKPPTLADLDCVLNILEFNDANDVISLAIEQGRQFYDNNIINHNNGGGIMSVMMNHNNNNNSRLEMESYRPHKSNVTVHKWPYVLGNGTRNNQDIVRIMKSMQPLLQNIHSKCRPRMREATYTVQGPLTWRQFHRLAGRGTGQCEPQPIPSVIVGHEKDWLSVAPYAIHYWDKLLLEPYSYSRDVVYLVIAPENDYIIGKTKTYFKELSTTYEMCKLGRHTPIKGWDGILQVSPKTAKSNNNNNNGNNNDQSTFDDWYQSLGDTKLSDGIRMYANAFQNALAPYLQRIPNDKSLLDPPESEKNSNQNHHHKDRPIPSPMPPPNTPDPTQPNISSTSGSTNPAGQMVSGGGISGSATNSISGTTQSDKAPNTPKSESEQDRDSLLNSSSLNTQTSDLLRRNDDDLNPPVIVLYVIEPFTAGSDSNDLQRIACLSLLRCYSDLLNTLPDSVRCNINLQIVSLESILELGRNRSRLKFSDEMKSFALSVFSQCRRFLTHSNTAKSLTGFGTAANMEIFLKNKDEKNKIPYKMYTPPYILAPVHEKSEKSDSFRIKSSEQQYSVMYCNYCISEDQSWLLATATDDRGELLETITINIDIPNRSRRKRAPARRMGLKKLMDFMLGIISQTVIPWRLVVGRIGRIGHGELKSWSWLLSKTNLQKASRQLKDLCKQCSLMHPNAVPSILSACVVTLEPDSKLKVMPDQFTPDERFSQISMHNPLSTPQDVTCTHILVFPTSAVCQSFQKAFNELNENEVFEGDNFVFDFEDEGQDQELGDLQFLNWDQIPLQQNSPERNSPHGSPSRIEDNRDRNSPSGNLFNSNRNMLDAQDMEEVGIVLQQPLAVGYYVSTAPTGRMPSWFWASCPHLEDVCPVFLKTALHLHVSSIQQNSDVDVLTQSHSSANDHPLDSTLTADVLRYVLEGYNVLSWLAMDSNTRDRLSCLPIHVQILMQLYHMTTALP